MKMGYSMALVHIDGYHRANNSLVNTLEGNLKVMENVVMKTEIFTKGSGRMEGTTDKGHFYVLMVNKQQEIGCKKKGMVSIY
jgi:hypothetical protein